MCLKLNKGSNKVILISLLLIMLLMQSYLIAYGEELDESDSTIESENYDESTEELIIIDDELIPLSFDYIDSNYADLQIKEELSNDVEKNEDNRIDFEFIDLPRYEKTTSDWAKLDIYSLYDKGYIKGYEDRTYRPSNYIRRDGFIKSFTSIITLKEDKDIKAKNFQDVADNISYELIRIASTNDIVRGYDDITFGPADNITNEQVMTILVRGLRYMNLNIEEVTTEEEMQEQFAKVIDGDKVSDWSKQDVATAIKYGLFIGNENRAIKPTSFTTRAQMAVVFERYITLIQNFIS